MFCSYCGTKLEDQVRFCYKCGKPTVNSQDTASQASDANQANGAQSTAETTSGTGFDIAEFWRKNASLLVIPKGSRRPNGVPFWVTECSPHIGPTHLKNVCSAKGMSRGMVQPGDILALVTYNPTGKPDGNSGGLIGYALCKEGFSFETMASVSDGLAFGAIGSAIKISGKSAPFIRYKDITAVSANGDYLYLRMKNGETKQLYMSSVFDGYAASRIFNELLEKLR